MDHETLQTDGWEEIHVEGFTQYLSPIWLRGAIGAREVALVVAPHHANLFLLTMNGGALMAFADTALSVGVSEAIGGRNGVTVQMQTQFIDVARVGDFLRCQPEILRRTRDLVFVRASFFVAERLIASSDGVFKILHDRSRQRHDSIRDPTAPSISIEVES